MGAVDRQRASVRTVSVQEVDDSRHIRLTAAVSGRNSGKYRRQAGEEVDGLGTEDGLVFVLDLAADVDAGGVVLIGHEEFCLLRRYGITADRGV